MNIFKLVKLLVISLVSFSLLVNLTTYFYYKNYENGNYGKYNTETKEKFIQSIPANTAPDKIDFTPWCANVKPDSYLATSGVLSSWSGLVFILSIISAILFVIFARKKLSKKYTVALIIILLISFVVFFQLFFSDAEYGFIGCKPY